MGAEVVTTDRPVLDLLCEQFAAVSDALPSAMCHMITAQNHHANNQVAQMSAELADPSWWRAMTRAQLEAKVVDYGAQIDQARAEAADIGPLLAIHDEDGHVLCARCRRVALLDGPDGYECPDEQCGWSWSVRDGAAPYDDAHGQHQAHMDTVIHLHGERDPYADALAELEREAQFTADLLEAAAR